MRTGEARAAPRSRRVETGTAELRRRLDDLYASYDQPDSVADPVNIVRRYTRVDDVEIAAFCAAALAFGRVASVMQSIETLFAAMGPSPADFVRRFEPAEGHRLFATFVHRWTRGRDIVALLWSLRQMLARAGSIENFFAEGDDLAATDVGPGLDSFSRRGLAFATGPAVQEGVIAATGARAGRGFGPATPRGPGVAYFFPCPSSGGGCKRLNLFLRWMVRRDGIDFGVWTRVSPARLVVPLDTHVIRLGRCLGLTRYRSPGWKMAAEITASLRALDPADPVRYDFALCHVGMMGACGFATPRADTQCPLRGCCKPRRRHGRDQTRAGRGPA